MGQQYQLLYLFHLSFSFTARAYFCCTVQYPLLHTKWRHYRAPTLERNASTAQHGTYPENGASPLDRKGRERMKERGGFLDFFYHQG